MNIASLKGQDMILTGRDDAKDGWKSRMLGQAPIG
jgi:hypothetical protein